MSGLKTNAEKFDYIDSLDLTTEQKNILVNKYGIAAGRINTIGHGVGDIFSEPAWNRVGICTIDEAN